MPPRQKFTREEIITQALAIVRTLGIEGLTARGLGEQLHSSARPIFTAFTSMDEVKEETIRSAKVVYDSYVAEGLQEPVPFKGAGMAYIRFAMEEPKLFQLLFMSEQQETSLYDTMQVIDDNHDEIREVTKQYYHLSEEQMKLLYEHLWIYTHGIATMCATHVYQFTLDQISVLLTQFFISIFTQIKEDKL